MDKNFADSKEVATFMHCHMQSSSEEEKKKKSSKLKLKTFHRK
jgi:hypothetical protein